MTTVSQSPNSDNTPATKSPFPARIMGRTHVVQRVFVAHEDISGGRRYELECAKLTGTEKYVHLDPRKELALYEAMLNLVPEIADLRENEAKNRYLVLAKQWEISYCLEPRAFKNGVRDVKVATNIRQIPPTKAFSVPSWATGEDDLKEFAADCNCVWFPGGFIDETLGMARSQWPDRKTCFDTVRAKQAETQPPKPRDANGEPIDLPQEGNVSDLQDTLTSVADEQAAQDKPKHFSQLDGFYRKVERLFTKRRQSAVLGTDKYMAKAHELMGVKSFTELIDITEAEFLSMLDDRLKVFCETSKQTQDEPKSDKTEKIDEKATPQGDSAPIGPDTPLSPPTPIAPNIPSSEPAIEVDVVLPPKPQLAIVQAQNEIILFDPNRLLEMAKGKVALLNRVYKEILVPGVDYGKVPGSEKDCLYKPGSEKLLVTFDFYDKCIPTANSISDWKAGFFNFEYECTIYNRVTGRIEGTGIGSCNSMESKYRYRWLWDNEAKTQGYELSEMVTKKFNGKNGKEYTKYRVENEDIFDQVNTLSKMGQKRALIAATLNATGASAIFTQDLEDFKDFGVFEEAA